MKTSHHTKKTENIQKQEEITAHSSKALLFELENLIINERELQFKALCNVMEKRDIKITEIDFIRFCVDKPSSDFIPKILALKEKTRLSKEKLEEEIEKQTRELIQGKEVRVNEKAISLLKKAVDKEIILGALSHWDIDTAADMAIRLNLDIPQSSMATSSSNWFIAKGEAWKQLSKTLGIPPKKSLSLVTSARSLKFSLYAGIPAIALPDKFTSAHDFGGSDFVFESLNDHAINTILTCMEDL